MNKLGLLCVVIALFTSGCGKKKASKEIKSPSKIAQTSTDIPLLNEIDGMDDNINNFAFIDDEESLAETKKSTPHLASSDGNTIISKDIDINEDITVTEDGQPDAYGFKTVLFDFNKNDIREDQVSTLEEDIKVAHDATQQGKKVIVEGHCDQIGSAAYNLALSERRAQSVKKEMVKAGIAADEIKTLGYGFEKPVVWSDSSDRATLIKELQANRRAEVLTN